MATKKQRRRREKERRHQWEYVTVDDDGDEVVVESPKDVATESVAAPARSGPTDARGRPVQKPSIQRLGKRAAIFGPLLIVLVFITGGDSLSTTAKIVQAILLLLVFIPLSYLLDHVMYRTLTRRHERKLAARGEQGASRSGRR